MTKASGHSTVCVVQLGVPVLFKIPPGDGAQNQLQISWSIGVHVALGLTSNIEATEGDPTLDQVCSWTFSEANTFPLFGSVLADQIVSVAPTPLVLDVMVGN